jgi:transaldolase
MHEITGKIKIFADGAILDDINWLIEHYKVEGFTTNPTLIRKGGVDNYFEFCKTIVKKSNNLPVSLEVISDDFDEMERQAYKLSNLAANVFVKIPITNTKSESSFELIKKLNNDGVQVNVTAVFTKAQIDEVSQSLKNKNVSSIVSIFAGRIADSGLDATEYVSYACKVFSNNKSVEILWCSTRQIYNIIEAINSGCDIITIENAMLPKIENFNKDLSEFSLETVKMFYNDAVKSKYTLL